MAAWKQVVKEETTRTRVPTFYAADFVSGSRVPRIMIISFGFSVLFAMVHLLAGMTSTFPTSTEQMVWLCLSLALLADTAFFGFIYLSHQGFKVPWPMQISKLTPLLAGIYILARITLFVLGFTTLRNLPPKALDTIHWPNFILIFIGN
jgi:hypothetical protein